MEWFRSWFDSPYYHQLYFERNEADARALVQRLLQWLKPQPGSRMLDAACGRGRHSCLLAEAGYEVTGIDLSPASIAYAKRYETEKLHFFQHDMRLPFWVRYFDVAFNFFTSFGYFATRREHDAALRSISQSLKPAGKLVIDYLNVPFVAAHLQPSETKTIGATTFAIRRWQDENRFYKRIQISGPDLQQPLEFTEQVAKFDLVHFTTMLAAQQLVITEVFGDYELNRYDAASAPRLIIVAQKKPDMGF